jgi:hypothetical protein
MICDMNMSVILHSRSVHFLVALVLLCSVSFPYRSKVLSDNEVPVDALTGASSSG